MKKMLLIAGMLLSFLCAKADEGMWIPSLIGKNYDEMVRLGLKLSKEDLWAINHASLKDAIVQFGGGCTAEMVSGNGLLITNHHCGYGSVAGLSTVEHNYLDNGFWAHNMMEELPAPGLSVIFLQSISDVTADVNKALGKSRDTARTGRLERLKKKMEDAAGQKGKYFVTLKEYFGGNQYLLLVYKKYTDVRLVGTPPKSLGKFGGDTDNWMWPRHTADFSMFRVYADSANEPSEYKTTNSPYHPAKYLPVSARGVQDGDFAMIYGYPGRTNRYEVSGGVDLAVTETNPDIVRLREERLGIMKRHMDADKSVYLKLTSRYAGIANYWKYFIGQTEQLKRLNVVDQKKEEEAAFTKWAGKNKDYAGLLSRYNAIFNNYRPYARSVIYYGEGFGASGLAKMAAALEPLAAAYEKNAAPPADTIKKYTDALAAARKATMKEWDEPTERDILAFSARAYYKDVPKSQLPDIYNNVVFKNFGSDNSDKTFTDYAAYVFSNTFLIDSNRFNAFIRSPSMQQIKDDAAAQYAISFVRNYKKSIQPRYERYTTAKAGFARRYQRGLMEMNASASLSTGASASLSTGASASLSTGASASLSTGASASLSTGASASLSTGASAPLSTGASAPLSTGTSASLSTGMARKMFYPDANSTMRITYGQVKSYSPQDAVQYSYYTTIDGLVAKYKAGDDEFDAPKEVIELVKKRDFGRWAKGDSVLHTCFITTNDITGGNSGSPVINANGEWIGAAFDGNWEAMSGDVAFDKKYKRTIVCDARYILFLIDKLGHAENLIEEMDVRY